MTYQQIAGKTTKTSFNHITSAFVLVDIKADLRSNSWLLQENLTRIAAKKKVLDGCAYPELRLK